MPFQMSLKAIIEEDLMEIRSLLERFSEDTGLILQKLDLNESMDHDNDRIRQKVRRALLDALKAQNMNDHGAMNNHVHAALQHLQDQEEVDLEDDLPRGQVRVKILLLQQKFISLGDALRKSLAKLNEETRGDGQHPEN